MRRRLPASIVALVSACAVVGASGRSTDSGVNAQTLESTEPATAVSLTAQSLPAPASSPVPVSSPPASTTAAAMTAALAIACVLLAGCTSASGVNVETLDPATSTSTASSTASASPSQSSAPPSSVLASPSPIAGTDSGLPAGEAADRAAVESQWVKSWDVYLAIAITPAADREALADTVTVDPTRANLLSDAAQFDSQGLQTYGALGHRISWPQPIAGGTTAVIDDCQDRSQAGSMKAATGDKLTVGVPRDHYQGSLVKGDDGIWRVAQVFYLKDEPC
jgi:hypothetical protein